MANSWQPKPGDKIFRPRRIKRYRLRRILGVPALFSAGYGNVGSSIYYALGIVAVVAMGATPIALGIAGILFIGMCDPDGHDFRRYPFDRNGASRCRGA